MKRLTDDVVVGRLEILLDEFLEQVSDAEQAIRRQHGADRHQCRDVSDDHGDVAMRPAASTCQAPATAAAMSLGHSGMRL